MRSKILIFLGCAMLFSLGFLTIISAFLVVYRLLTSSHQPSSLTYPEQQPTPTLSPIYVPRDDTTLQQGKNGNQVYFVSNFSGKFDLYSFDLETKNMVNLTKLKMQGMSAVLSPEGGHFVILSSSEENYNYKEIYVGSVDGTNLVKLDTPKDTYSISGVVWSPDSSRFIFLIDTFDKKSTSYGGFISQFVISRADGSDLLRIYPLPGELSFPTWSPDGKNIIFEYNQNDIYKTDSNGNHLQKLTSSKIVGKAWSPKGDKITYASIGEGNDLDIFIMNSDGSNKINISNSIMSDDSPSWSRDGRYILFECDNHRVRGNENIIFNVCLIDLRTMAVKNLTNRTETNYTASGARPLSWVPSTNRILFISVSDNQRDLFSMDVDGNNITQITRSSSFNSFILSPNEDQVVFTTWTIGGAETSLYISNLDGSNQQKLLTYAGYIELVGWQPEKP
jgi:Tol biopolymer transport system component